MINNRIKWNNVNSFEDLKQVLIAFTESKFSGTFTSEKPLDSNLFESENIGFRKGYSGEDKEVYK